MERENERIDYSKAFYDKELRVKRKNIAKGLPIDLSIELVNVFAGFRIDCRAGSIEHDFWYRTAAGMKARKYKTRKGLESAVENVLRENGFEIIEWKEAEE